MLEAKNIHKSFEKTEVLHDVSVNVPPGKISVIIGPSGSGKTTLLKILAFLEPADRGALCFDDQTYPFPWPKKNHIKPPWPEVTVVFQQLFLWPHLTLLQNLTMPLFALKRENQGKVDRLIDLLHMGEFIDRYPNEVSLGQRQRAAVARALLLEPKYLLLDEITSSLDVEQVSIILSLLKDLRSEGTGILLITHLLQFARDAADQIIFMDDGSILEEGGPEVLANPKHARVQKFLSVIESAR